MFQRSRWNPYLVGILIGCLSLVVLALFHHTVGTTTTFVRLAAVFWQIINPQHLAESAYYSSYLKENAWINWQAAFVGGIFLGAFIASRSAKDKVNTFVPELWEQSFGPSKIKRSLGAFAGGFILLFGARLAGGCTSGHVIGGGMQLSLAGWLFMMAFFASGLPTAHLLYRKSGD